MISAVIIDALLSAGATEEMIAAAVEADRGEQDRRLAAFRAKDAARKRRERAAKRQLHPTGSSGRLGSRPGSASDERPAGPLDTAINAAGLAERLTSAASGNVDQLADTGSIVDLLDQGCDLDLDVLPVVATWVSDLPRPLRNWGAPWLMREILAARDHRLTFRPDSERAGG